MNILFLMNPLETVVFEKDTSFILMLGAHKRGHHVFYLPVDGIYRVNGCTKFNVTHVVPQNNKEQPFLIQKTSILEEKNIDIIFIRTDPPFDQSYLHHTFLLDLVDPRIKIINHPTTIRSVNEKIWATQFTDIVPHTLVGRNIPAMLEFLNKEEKIVAKPTDGFGGQSVFIIKKNDTNTNVIFETLTQNGTRDIILQKFVEDAKVGDKRIILLNGEPLGAVLRVHSSNDHRNNFFAGGHAIATDITKRDLEIITILKPYLQKLKLYFVGIDIIGTYLIEVNVTSPTCLQEMNRLYKKTLEDDVIQFVENLK